MHSFKKISKTILLLAMGLAVLIVLDLMLYPCTFMRNDVHAICTISYDDIIVGTSNGKMNIDPEAMQSVNGRSGHNLCVGGEYGMDAYYLVRLAAEKQKPSRIIYEVDPGYFTSQKEEGNNYLLFFHEFPFSRAKRDYFLDSILKCNFRTILFPWYEYDLSYEVPKIAETFQRKIQRDYDVSHLKGQYQEYHESGFMERYAVDTTKLKKTEMKGFEVEDVIPENMEYLEKIINFCKEQGIEFIAVTTPLPAATLVDYEQNYRTAWSYFGDFFEEHDVKYYNFNAGYNKAFSHKLVNFTDFEGHMNGESAVEFSKILAKIIG